ncbi:hypothetical protein Vi05172_g8034 [Venturia inaequalis]|nr:hypothetical protein Vi05172_g8034 [Venturia inaequalis]
MEEPQPSSCGFGDCPLEPSNNGFANLAFSMDCILHHRVKFALGVTSVGGTAPAPLALSHPFDEDYALSLTTTTTKPRCDKQNAAKPPSRSLPMQTPPSSRPSLHAPDCCHVRPETTGKSLVVLGSTILRMECSAPLYGRIAAFEEGQGLQNNAPTSLYWLCDSGGLEFACLLSDGTTGIRGEQGY